MRRSLRVFFVMLLAVLPVLSACAPVAPSTGEGTPRPIPTRIGIPIASGPTPTTAAEPIDATFTPLPVDPLYDPLRQTQTAQAALPSATPIPMTPVPSATPPPPIPTGTLAGGILGLIPTQQGLWAMRGDGSQLTLLTNDPIDRLVVTPNGRLAAYVTHANPGSYLEQPYGYLLKLITLYNGMIYPVASLDPPWISAASAPAELEAAANSLAAYSRGALAWSPGGSYLAFTSSHEAPQAQPPSSDIYLYAPSSGMITRLTRIEMDGGAVHPYDLQWSRDSSHMYFSAAYTFGIGSTPTRVAGAWIAGLDGTLARVDDIGRPDGAPSNGEDLVSWLPNVPTAVLMASRSPTCPRGNLRVVDYVRGSVTTLWPGCYADMVYSRARDEALISVTPAEAASPTGASLEPGLYRVRRATAQAEKISDQWFERLYSGDSSSSWYGYQPGSGLSAIRSDGAVTPIYAGAPYDGSTGEALSPLDRLPNSAAWLWKSQAAGTVLLANPGQPPTPLFDLQPSGLTESPTAPGTYFFTGLSESGLTLYGVRSGDWQPFVVDQRIRDPQGVIWTQ